MAVLAWETIIEALLAGERPPTPEPEPLTLTLDPATHHCIEGDNLAVLRALHPAYQGQIRLAYLDPPYNTGHRRMYRDQFALPVADYRAYLQQLDPSGRLARRIPEKAGRSHLGWLTMLIPRLQALQPLLHPTGMLFCSIDDTELAYLGVTLRRLFGESNYLTTIVWVGRIPSNSVSYISTTHEYLLCLTPDRAAWEHQRATEGRPSFTTLWRGPEVGTTATARRELRRLLGERGQQFDTPKPTGLIRRMLEIATGPQGGDLVLDPFAGSATTADAVLTANAADEGDRRFILIQEPQPTGQADYPTVATVGRARIAAVQAQLYPTEGLWPVPLVQFHPPETAEPDTAAAA